MNEDNKLVPELRFPEFVNEGKWEMKTIAAITSSESSSLALNKLKLNETGYPVYGADSIVGYIDEYQQEEKYISIVKDGSGVGRLNLCKSHSSILGTLACIKSKDFDKYNLEWIYFLLNTIDFTSYKKGSGIPHIYYSDFKFEIIGLPKLREQQKIASCLSSLDEVITAHSQKLEALKDHKKGIMQNLFPQEGERVPAYRFPEFREDGEWEEKTIEQVFSIFQGYAFSSTDSVSSGARWLKIADVGIQEMKHDSPSFLPETFKEEYKRFLLKKGDYIMALTRPILDMKLKIAQVDDKCNNSLLNQRVGKLVTSNVSTFVYYLIQTTSIVESINRNIAGNEPPNLSFQQISDIVVFIPKEKNEQKKIATCLSSLDELIIAHSEKIKQLQLHKKGLMQGLFPKIS